MRRSRVTLLAMLAAAGCGAAPETATRGRHVERMLEDDRFDWITVATDHFQIHFPAGSHAESHRDLLPARSEEARHSVLGRLSVTEYGEPLHLFYVDSREDMERLTGRPVA